MAIPPLHLQFDSNSSAKSGDAVQYGSSLGSPLYVNFGNGVMQGGAVPSWTWLAAAGLLGWWLWRRSR